MVYLSSIVTKAGDDGCTMLGDGSRIAKHDPRMEAIGDVDELGATLGLFLAHAGQFPDRAFVEEIANDLFDVGADLCLPITVPPPERPPLRITDSQIGKLELAVERVNADLAPLNSFILRGGTPAAAWCHLACTVCRRAERRVSALLAEESDAKVNHRVLVFLNRLSDYLFVLARLINHNGTLDVLWKPGEGRRG
jgi:cob(I)alamin adenosyltransferase